MSDEQDYGRKSATWSAASASESETFPAPIEVRSGQEVAFTFTPSLPMTVQGVTLYDAASGQVHAALKRDESGGELVQVDPSEAVIGAALSADGGRWVTADEDDE